MLLLLLLLPHTRSRNVNLTSQARAQPPAIYAALSWAQPPNDTPAAVVAAAAAAACTVATST
jgi:pantothenate synthetase